MRYREPNIEIRLLQSQDIDPIASAARALGGNKPASQYERYLAEQQEGRRVVLLAFADNVFAGYLTIVWNPDYPPFRVEKIPEIHDLNVLPNYRRRGVATALMDRAEQIVASRSSVIGIGVGMDADYGPAQRLYVLRGYVPDAKGLFWRNSPVKYGDPITVDDDLVLHLMKKLVF